MNDPGELNTDETAVEQDFEKPRPWLVALMAKARQNERPQNKALGHWLGDFLDQDTPNGLLKTELLLLDSCMSGSPCRPTAKPPLAVAEPAGNLAMNGDDKRRAEVLQNEGARLDAVRENRVRAEFLRFLVLGGDEFAPVHERGIDLHNAFIFGSLNLSGGKCVGQVALVHCFVWGLLNVQDASLGMLALSGTWLQGDAERWTAIEGNRVRVFGSVFLDRDFVSKGNITLFSAQIGGSIICTSANIFGTFICAHATIGADLICVEGNFLGGIEAQGTAIIGSARFSSLSAKRPISLAGADIGGSFRCEGASLRKDQTDIDYLSATMLDVSRAAIKGDVLLSTPLGKPFVSEGAVSFASARIGGDLVFWSASITVAETARVDGASVVALDGRKVKVGGSILFGVGFETNGQVSFYGAEIANDLDFSGSSFRNAPGLAIVVDMANVWGSLKFQTSVAEGVCYPFRAFGVVSLVNTKCADMSCEGGCFNNPHGMAINGTSMNVAGSVILGTSPKMRFEALGGVIFNNARIGQNLLCFGGRMENKEASALDCEAANILGSVSLRNNGNTPFEAFGQVSFYFAQIGINLDCGGGRFINPKGYSMDCQGSNIKGCVLLGEANSYGGDIDKLARLAFWSDGIVKFMGAKIGLRFDCQSGYFHNGEEYAADSDQAAIALDLSEAEIDALVLGKQDTGSHPPTIEGSVNLSGATVRVLVDAELIGNERDAAGKRGLWQKSIGTDGVARGCYLMLDQFTYERLKGDGSCDSDIRAAWLQRQPPQHLTVAFKSQPFKQLINVMRAMGYDDDADHIAFLKRVYEWKAAWLTSVGPVRDRLATLRDQRILKAQPRYAAEMSSAGSVSIGWADEAVFGGKAIAVVVAAWLIIIGHAWAFGLAFLLLAAWKPAGLTWKILTSAMEYVFVNKFIGYGFRMGRAVVLLLLLVGVFGSFYNRAFHQGAIVPADKDIRDKTRCKVLGPPKVWSVENCSGIADLAIPFFNPWLYSADVMVPVVTLGQKAAWAPNPNADVKLAVREWKAPTNIVYYVQLVETVLGWVEGFLLVSFVTGLISKGGGGTDQ